jgi:hypothetical protein
MLVIVDTNVPIVANRKSPQASPECVKECARRLGQITKGKARLALDDKWQIINEYKNKLNEKGQPGIGDSFLKWVLTNQANAMHCVLVPITPQGESFAEFPSALELQNFDRSDRKFVAVALAHPDRPPILQAVDTDWWGVREALSRNGVQIEFLCPEDMVRLVARRQR